MKSLLINKLNNKGVSILFAMLLFLVVSLVSVTIVAASYTSVKRTNSVRETNQETITLDSAALMLKNEIDGQKYTYISTIGSITGIEWGGEQIIKNNSAYFINEVTTISRIHITAENLKKIDSFTNKCFDIKSSDSNLSNISVSYIYNLKFEKDYISYIIFSLTNNNTKETIYERFDISSDYKEDKNRIFITYYYYYSTYYFKGVYKTLDEATKG